MTNSTRAFFVGFLVVLAATCTGLATRLLHDTPEHVRPPHAARPTAGVNPGPLPLTATGAYPGEVIEAVQVVAYLTAIEGERERERIVEAERLAADEAARVRYVAPTGSSTPPAPPAVAAVASDDATFEAFRVCTLAHESGGNYEINTGNGYYGAWQFLQSTWDSVARNAGYDEWVGRRPSDAPPEIQDAVARFLWEHSGNRPWGGRC